MGSMPWFRMWNDTLSDRKLKLISIETDISKVVILGAWTGLLILASESPERGAVLSGSGKPLPIEFIADEIGIDSSDLSAILACFEDMGMVLIEDAIHITNWSKRQPKSDDSYSRVKKFRAKKRIENDDYKKRFRNVSSNDTESELDTDNNKDTNVSLPEKPAGPKTQISNHLLEITGLKMPRKKSDLKYYWSEIAELEHIGNKDPATVNGWIDQIVPYMREEGLSIHGPQSIKGFCNQLAAGQPLGGRQNGKHSNGTKNSDRIAPNARTFGQPA